MKIPTSIKVGGLTYSVSREDNLLRDREAFGQSCGNAQTIAIDSAISGQMAESTFVHEVMHSLDFVYHIELSHDQIFRMEAALYALIKDNPQIFET